LISFTWFNFVMMLVWTLETALCDRQLEGCQRQLLEVKPAAAVGFHGTFQADVGRGKHHLGTLDGPTRAVEHGAGDAAVERRRLSRAGPSGVGFHNTLNGHRISSS
jgi:hypothetical protein